MNPYSAASRSWITDAFIRISARNIASTSGANSSIFLGTTWPLAERRGGVAGPARYDVQGPGKIFVCAVRRCWFEWRWKTCTNPLSQQSG